MPTTKPYFQDDYSKRFKPGVPIGDALYGQESGVGGGAGGGTPWGAGLPKDTQYKNPKGFTTESILANPADAGLIPPNVYNQPNPYNWWPGAPQPANLGSAGNPGPANMLDIIGTNMIPSRDELYDWIKNLGYKDPSRTPEFQTARGLSFLQALTGGDPYGQISGNAGNFYKGMLKSTGFKPQSFEQWTGKLDPYFGLGDALASGVSSVGGFADLDRRGSQPMNTLQRANLENTRQRAQLAEMEQRNKLAGTGLGAYQTDIGRALQGYQNMFGSAQQQQQFEKELAAKMWELGEQMASSSKKRKAQRKAAEQAAKASIIKSGMISNQGG